MGDMVETFRALDELRKETRRSDKEENLEVLKHFGVDWGSNNSNVHCIIVDDKGKALADFWPSTNKFKMRGSRHYRHGTLALLKDLGVWAP